MATKQTVVDSNGCDMTPRYAPTEVSLFANGIPLRACVRQALFHPAGTAPAGCPIRIDCNVLELRTGHGSRWYGVKRAWINSELRMVVQGFPARFEEMAAWPIATSA